MIRTSSIGRSFISVVGNPCRAALAVVHWGRSSRVWNGGRVKSRWFIGQVSSIDLQ